MNNKNKFGRAQVLWLTNLLSIFSSTIIYIYFSSYIYRSTDNIVLSDLIFMAPMILPVILYFTIADIVKRYRPKAILIYSNIACLILSYITFSYVDDYISLAFLSCLTIGLLDTLQRTSRMVMIKSIYDSESIKSAISLITTAQFVAGGAAGTTILYYGATSGHQHLLVLTGLLYFSAILIALLLPDVQNTQKEEGKKKASISQLLTLLRDNKQVGRLFLNFVIFVSLFQGFFSITRVALPIHQMGLSDSLVGLLQITISLAAVSGALAFHFMNKKEIEIETKWFTGFAVVSMLVSTTSINVVVGFAFYFSFMFLFEISFFKHQSKLVIETPESEMGIIATFQYSMTYLGIIISILIGSALTDFIGLELTAITYSLVAVLFIKNCYFNSKAQAPLSTSK